MRDNGALKARRDKHVRRAFLSSGLALGVRSLSSALNKGSADDTSVKKDHYSTLGVTPASEDVAIRGAYRALMRRYHPDADPSGEAAERAREINEAYRVLSDPERRARYDSELIATKPLKFEPQAHPVIEERKNSRAAPVAALGVAAAAAAMIAFAVSPTVRDFVAPNQASSPAAVEQPLPIARPEKLVPAKAEAESCADPAATDLIKRELFRQAATRRPADRQQFEDVAAHANLRVEARKSETSGCGGWLALDLPRGLVVDGGRTNLNADVAFTLEVGKGGLRLARLTGAAPLVRSLATLGPEPQEPALQEAKETKQIAEVVKSPAKPPKPPALPKIERRPDRQAVVTSSCNGAASRSEKMICADQNLSSLDRQLALLYRQSWKQADEGKKASLLGTRQRFNDRREACASPNCLTTAYVSRLREISDIMAGKLQQ